MASTSKESGKVLEGVFAIHKPQWSSSAGVLRDLQTHFQPSALFAPWLVSQRRNMIVSGSRKRDIDKLKIKLGHGGTLDPLATGVLIVGVGKGTKCLQRFLDCTKSYECVVLFGAATDSYDSVGKVVSRAPHQHVTKELVEQKLENFRGKIMQKPSIFSALKVDGKKMYEYARAGGEVPEVKARPVEVQELELVEWLEPGTHDFEWPKEEVDSVEKAGAEKLMGVSNGNEASKTEEKRGTKREREDDDDDHITDSASHPKKPKTEDEPAMSGALPVGDEQPNQDLKSESAGQPNESPANPQPPAARLRMTVTSGFYVRSLCHDLGLACDSRGLMSSLIRSRQGDYDLGKNVFEYEDLKSGPEVWEPKLRQHLEDFMSQEGWEAEQVEDDEEWQAHRKEREDERRENDRDRSYQGNKDRHDGGGRGHWKKGGGGGGGKGNWKHRQNRTYYSKDMNGGRDKEKQVARD